MASINEKQMPHISVLLVRAKRFVRLWLRDACTETVAPLTDANARLNYIAVFFVVLVLSPKWGVDRPASSLVSAAEAIQATLYSVPMFFAMNLLFAIFRVRKSEREKGEWFGPRFVYHDPKRLMTALVDERDNGTPIKFAIDDVEDNAFVSFAIETDRADQRVKVELAWPNGKRPMESGVPMNIPKAGFRLPPSREMCLLTHVEPNSTLTTVRVYMTKWEVGKGDGRL